MSIDGLPDLRKFSDVYVDESSQTKHRFMLLGALVVPTPLVERLAATLQRLREPELPKGEMAWVKVSRAKLPAYLRFVEEILHPSRWPLNFNAIIVDTHKINDHRYNIGSREIGFNKEIYQILLKCWRRRPERNFHAYLDKRYVTIDPNPEVNKEATLNRLRTIVNMGIMKESSAADWPIRRIHFRESSESVFLQATDILLGALAFHVNGHYGQPDAAPAKRALSERILQLGEVEDPMKDSGGRYSIWWRQLH